MQSRRAGFILLAVLAGSGGGSALVAQGVTTAAMNGIVTDTAGNPLPQAVVVAVHTPTGTRYQSIAQSRGVYTLPNMRVGGPYTVTVRLVGYSQREEQNVFVSLAQSLRLDFQLAPQVIELSALTVTAEQDEVLNADRTGAATTVSEEQVAMLPSIKRSTRDLTRLDPRSDGNFAFGGRNWLYNNISLDGSYFSNSFGLDDPAPGGQTAAEPVPFDAVEQVQVSVAPFDVRQGGFTGANINTVTRSGTNQFSGSVYSFLRSEAFLGNEVSGNPVIANPDLSFLQSGVRFSGPIVRDKLFFFINAELERRDDPGTNFVADRDGNVQFGESRVSAATMDSISDRLRDVYGYETGAYDGYIHQTDNNKLLVRLDWNLGANHNLMLRYNMLDAGRDLGPHPFVLSFNNTGRGPNEASLPFQNSGYQINNELHSFALELNSRSSRLANRFFASYNRFRDFRNPFSVNFPTLEIGEAGLTYTTAGHEPFSIHNILDQDVWQLTDNLTYFTGGHSITVGANFELFSFFNSFNLFRNGLFGFGFAPTTFPTVADFFAATDPANPIDLEGFIGGGPFKGENIDVGQLGLYLQDEFLASSRFTVTGGVRVDFPMYLTDPVDNPYARSLTALDENGNPETVDQSSLPGATPMFSPRIGFNWNAVGERSTQVRGGTGIFTGRVPFVWIGNVISNPGANPNLYPDPDADSIPTSDDAILQQSFDLNAMDPDFKWPQVWTTDIAIDQQLPGGFLGTLEMIYGKDLNAVFMRNADLVEPVRTLADGRPYYGGFGANELNSDGGAGIYVIDNVNEGHNLNVTAQLRKAFRFGMTAGLGYSFTEAKNSLKSTEIASVLWQNQPVQGNPNQPGLSYSEFGNRHRIVASATYSKSWSNLLATHFGMFFQAAEGNTFAGAGGNRYSYIYAGDVNGDGQGGNDLIYIPVSQGEIQFVDYSPDGGQTIVTADEQWAAFNAFVEQDTYLSTHRGQIAERFGGINPWFTSLDLRVLQDFAFGSPGREHRFQLSIDLLNALNLLDNSWGVRKVATPAATSPLQLAGFDANGEPQFNFTSPGLTTFVSDPSLNSRWQMQIGLRYLFN
jgi:hypothetical protein